MALLVALALAVGPSDVATATPTRSSSIGLTRGDNVHVSSTLPPTASAHGWWEHPDQSLQADVTVWLQVKRGATWEFVGEPGAKRVRPGSGGSGRRANVRVPCLGGTPTEWRSVVDVDVVGKIDSPGRLIRPTQLLPCGA